MPKPRSVASPHAVGIVGLVLAAVVSAAAAPDPARAQASGTPAVPRPPVPRVAAADPAFEAAQAAFQALPEGARRDIQDALAWTGHYASVVSGAFGRRTFDAILAYQRATKVEPNGILGDAPRAALLAAGRRAREAAGFALRTDAATGIALGVPARLLPREQKAARGTRWQSPDGRITLETRAFDPAEGDLQATFDRVSATTPERKVTYRLKRPDFLVVTGETPTGRFYIRYAQTPAGVRGFTLAYDKALAAAIDPVVIAVANSFDPVPGAAAPAVPADRPPAVGATGARPNPAAPALAPASPTRTATGLMVAPGRLLTSVAALAECPAPRLDREPARPTVPDEETGLALLAVSETASIAPVGIAPAPPPETDLIAIGVGPSGEASVVPGAAGAAERLLAPLQPGAAGAPILDREGRLVGLLRGYPGAPRLVAGIAPPTTYAYVPGATVAAFLTRHGIAVRAGEATGARSTGEVASLFAGRVRRILCD